MILPQTTLIAAHFAAVLLCTSFLWSCKKPDEASIRCTPVADCEGIPILQRPNTGYNFITEGRCLESACYNPNNEAEMAIQLTGTYVMDTVLIDNQSTGKIRSILSTDMWWRPHWGKNNRILLGLFDGQIFTIKPDGTDLQDISQSRRYYISPVWNASCTRIYAGTLDGPDVLLTLNGTVADSFEINASDVDFIDDDRFAIAAGIYTLSTRQFERVTSELSSCRMISANEFVWSNNGGIHKINIATRQIVLLKESCPSLVYMHPSVNASRTKMLWSRVDRRVDTCHLPIPIVYEDYEIVEMNIDGTGEREIPIPE